MDINGDSVVAFPLDASETEFKDVFARFNDSKPAKGVVHKVRILWYR